MTEAIRFARAAFRHAAVYVRGDISCWLAMVGALAAVSVVVDLLVSSRDLPAVDVVIGFATLYLQLLVTFRALAAADIAPPGYVFADMTEKRFVSAFVLSLFYTIGVVIGGLALVIPGILLAALWSVAQPALAAERLSPSEALRRSWRLMRPAIGGGIVILAVFVSSIALAVLVTLALPAGRGGDIATLVVSDVVMPILLMFSPAVWVSAYQARREATTA